MLFEVISSNLLIGIDVKAVILLFINSNYLTKIS
jgi:hypothetical protein